MIADHPGRLVESNLVANLATPLQLEDTSWIIPAAGLGPLVERGLGAGRRLPRSDEHRDHEVLHRPRRGDGLGVRARGLGWYGPITDFDTGGVRDCTKPVRRWTCPRSFAYAKERTSRCFLLDLWTHLDQRLDRRWRSREWGVAGIKVDFMVATISGWFNLVRERGRKAAETT